MDGKADVFDRPARPQMFDLVIGFVMQFRESHGAAIDIGIGIQDLASWCGMDHIEGKII